MNVFRINVYPILVLQKQSTAAMDCEPLPSASKRIRSTDKRLGPREDVKTNTDPGFKVYVSNLHHKVTEEDILVCYTMIICLAKVI